MQKSFIFLLKALVDLLHGRLGEMWYDDYIFGKVGRAASVEVVLHLMKTKCLPVLLYGLEVCSLTKADQRTLDFAVIRFK